jgi:hypothetical protein
MGPTTRGLPYPEPTDPVAAGADAIKALADALNLRIPRMYGVEYTAGPSTGNGVILDLTASLQPAQFTGRALITFSTALYSVGVSMGFTVGNQAPNRAPMSGLNKNENRQVIPAWGANSWIAIPSSTIATPIVAGVKPTLTTTVFVGTVGTPWHLSHAIDVIEIPA